MTRYQAWLQSASARMCQLDNGFAVAAGVLDVNALPTGRTGLAIERVVLLEQLLSEAKALPELSAHEQLDVDYFAMCVQLERYAQLELGERLHNPDALTTLGDLLMTVLFAPYSSEEERFLRIAKLLDGVPGYLAEAVTTFGQPDPLLLEIAGEVAADFSEIFAAIPLAARGRAGVATQERLTLICERGRGAVKDYQNRLRDLRGVKNKHILGSDKYAELTRLKGYPFSVAELRELGADKLGHLKEDRKQTARRMVFLGDEKTALRMVRGNHPASFDGALQDVRRIVLQARDYAYERELVRPPRYDEVLVIETPAFAKSLTPVAAILTARAYWPLQRSTYYVTRGESLEDLHYASLTSVVAHEAYPGHHLQYAVANERGSLMRNLPWNTLTLAAMGTDCTEGWAHYCEALMKRAGFHSEISHGYFALNLAVVRAVRVVVDVGLQTGQLTQDQAMQQFVDDAGVSPAVARAEVRAALRSPGYNLGYTIGKHQIKTLRGECSKLAGNGIKNDMDYHELVMTHGQAPLCLLERRAALLAAQS